MRWSVVLLPKSGDNYQLRLGEVSIKRPKEHAHGRWNVRALARLQVVLENDSVVANKRSKDTYRRGRIVDPQESGPQVWR